MLIPDWHLIYWIGEPSVGWKKCAPTVGAGKAPILRVLEAEVSVKGSRFINGGQQSRHASDFIEK
jgi:hypothetical protein